MDSGNAMNASSFEQLPPLRTKWKVLHKLISSSSLRLNISRSFIATAKEFDIELPEEIQNKFCPYCNAFFPIPGMSEVRLRHRGKRAKVNKGASIPPGTFRNEIIIRCLTCKLVTALCGGSYRKPKNITSNMLESRTPSGVSTPGVESSGDYSVTKTTAKSIGKGSLKSSKRFSFLDRLDSQRDSMSSRLSTPDFVSFSPTANSNKSFGGSTSRVSLGGNSTSISLTGSSEANIPAAVMNLDLLERENKKKRKRSLQESQSKQQRVPSESASAPASEVVSINAHASLVSDIIPKATISSVAISSASRNNVKPSVVVGSKPVVSVSHCRSPVKGASSSSSGNSSSLGSLQMLFSKKSG